MNEEVLKEIIKRRILGCCQLQMNTQKQILDWLDGTITFADFSDESKFDLSHYYQMIQKLYYLDAKEFLPNIFYVEGQ